MSEQTQNQEVLTTPDALYARMVPVALARLSGPGVSEATARELAHGLASECVAECGRLGLFEQRTIAAPLPSQLTHLHVDGQLAAQPEVADGAVTVVGGVSPVTGSPSVPTFAPQGPVPGAGAPAVMPIGAPNQPTQHYNHLAQPTANGGQPQTTPIAPAAYTAMPQMPLPKSAAPQPNVVQSDVPWHPPHLDYMYQKSPAPAASVPVPEGTGVGVPQPAQMTPGQGATLAPQTDVGGQRIVTATGDGFMPPAPAGLMNTVVHIATPASHSALGLNGVISQPEQKPNQYQQIVAPQGQRVVTPVGAGGSTYVPEHIVK